MGYLGLSPQLCCGSLLDGSMLLSFLGAGSTPKQEQAGKLQTWTWLLVPSPAALKSPLPAAPALHTGFAAVCSASQSNLSGVFIFKVTYSVRKILLGFI